MGKKGKTKPGCSAAGRQLAQCRWGKPKAKAKPKSKPKPKPKPKAPTRASRRLAGKEPVRQTQPAKKPRKRRPPDRAAKPSAVMTRMSNIISPGVVETKATKNMFGGRQYKTMREAEAARWNAGYGNTRYRVGSL
jgi:outer membrane biosynthesis protein TonB